jgi:ubiquinone/menaquinone biosynthesis C-methylase UbiE
MTILRDFIRWNARLSRFCSVKNLSEFGSGVEYLRVTTILFSSPDVRSVADVGAGPNWGFPLPYKVAYGLELTGIDIDEEGLKENPALDKKIVGDVCDAKGFGDGRYDLITCSAGIEHFPNVQKFLDNAFCALRPGGAVVAQFTSSTARFAMLNKALPQATKRRILDFFFPGQTSSIGYPVFYDRCRYTTFKAAAEKAGLTVEYYLPCFGNSGYFAGLFPVFMVSQFVDLLCLVFGSKNLASYHLFILRRPGDHFKIKWSWNPAEEFLA